LSPQDAIERSIFAFRVETNISFNEIASTINFISSLRSTAPKKALLDVGTGLQYLFLSDSGSIPREGTDMIWAKFGWARRAGLPETLDVSTGRVDVLRLSGEVYIYEPTHFLLFNKGDEVFMLNEYNMFAPRATRLCQYIAEFYKRTKKDINVKVRVYPRLLFVKNVERLLREYETVKSISIELKPSGARALGRFLGQSESVLQQLLSSFSARTTTIRWKCERGGSLNITIDKVLEIFYELQQDLGSFRVRVGKIGMKPVDIDLTKSVLVFKKYIRLARDESGNLLRSSDTKDAIKVLAETVNDVLSQL